jgi:hypothetical protein
VAVDVTPVRPESEQLINQAIIKKAKADGMENEIRIDEDGNLQNRDELLQEFIAKLSTQKSAATHSNSAYKAKAADESLLLSELALTESVLMSELVVELEIAEFEADLRADLALNSLAPVKLVAASKTATNSELFMYLGALILLLILMFRRRLLA